jgi:hypothetical protein
VLSVDTTEASLREWRRRESNPLLLVASEAPIPMGFIPETKGGRPDSNRCHEDHHLGCSPLHHGHHERGRPDSNRRPIA